MASKPVADHKQMTTTWVFGQRAFGNNPAEPLQQDAVWTFIEGSLLFSSFFVCRFISPYIVGNYLFFTAVYMIK